ncbi:MULTISPECIES: MDR family MFS transporter [Bacillus]|uniref:Major facilitator superfamily (MFS) profile domain-containing protein n=1 Tax=Bacillus wiedmannii TaxID=1890302 RepID=A0AB37YM31_9BACI|nr:MULTISPECIES: MFS transporter [Bacillus]MCU5577869.1 MFS transporter [Bacillus wiedmannii]MDM5265038.1 MFS transporter [Bacillus wiedmannii]MDR4943266.1 MFS transporter [Bacillus wiedmannii]MED3319381.1 MFS transporter [Bacillus wiedmannii]MEE3949832.1 MFS transporter [Bacillus wiedmannii]
MNKFKAYIREYHPIVHVLVFGTVLISLTSSMSMPFLAIHLSNSSELNFATIGFIIGVGPLAGTFCGLLGGVLSDFIGRKKLMIFSLIGLSIAFLGFITTFNPVLLVLFSIIRGLSNAFFGTISKALMADLTPDEKRYRMFANRYLAFNLGLSIGPMLGAFFGIGGSTIAFVLTAFIYILYAIVLFIMLKVTNYNEQSDVAANDEKVSMSLIWNAVRSDVPLMFFVIGGILLTTVHGQMSVTLSQYLKENILDGIKLFAILMSVNGLTVLTIQIPLTRWAERFSLFQRIAMGCILFAVGEIGFAFSTLWVAFIISMFVFTVGEILVIPAEYAQVDEITPSGLRGTYYGAQSLGEFGNFVGPWFGGILLAVYGGTTMFVFMALISLLGIYFFYRGKQIYNKKEKKDSHLGHIM